MLKKKLIAVLLGGALTVCAVSSSAWAAGNTKQVPSSAWKDGAKHE